MSVFEKNFSWQDKYIDEVKGLLISNIGAIIRIEKAPDFDDMTRATDIFIKVVGGSVAVRIRRSSIKYRDWTIRSKNNGYKTELQKLLDGHADWYFYGWVTTGKILEWVIIDLHEVRKTNILTKARQERSNGDGTYFVAVPISELVANGCIVASEGIL